MPYLYVLKNNNNRYYIGITSLSIDERLERHNCGSVASTKVYKPWIIIHQEFFKTLMEARDREKLIKSWKGGSAFKKLVSKAAGSSNGRTLDSGSSNLGSNPGPAALERRKKLAG